MRPFEYPNPISISKSNLHPNVRVLAPRLVALGLLSLMAQHEGFGEPMSSAVILVTEDYLPQARDVALDSPQNVVLLTSGTREVVCQATQWGVQALVALDDHVSVLLEAVAKASSGAAFCTPTLLPLVMQALREQPLPATDGCAATSQLLTEREEEIAKLVARGKSNAEVARELFVSQATVKFHLGNIYKKLEIRRRGQVCAALPQALGANALTRSST